MFQWQHLQESGQHFMQRQQHGHAQETGQNQCSININSMQHHAQETLQHQRNINSMQWAAGVPQSKMNAAHGGSQMFGGAPYTSYQGHFLVPVKPEVCQLPINQMRIQFMQFVHVGPVNFDTLVFHTGTGEVHKLGFYFNEHIVSIVVLNAMFNNSSSGDRAQFDQAPELRLFNMQNSQGTLGGLNQVLHMTADQVCRQQEMDQQHQAWRMEAAHAHLRTLDWVLHQEPYDGSDAQASVDREEEMIRMREVEQDVDMEQSEEEVNCAFTTMDVRVPASFLESKVDEAQVQPHLSPRRTRSGAILTPRSRDEAMSEGSAEEGPSLSPRRTRNGAFY